MDGSIDTQERLEEIPLDRIDPSPTNPRKRVDAEQLKELAVDLEANGQIQPVRVRPTEGDRYQLVVGERRWRAMALTPRTTITAIVRAYGDREALEVQISENGQREDVHPLEEADAFRHLHVDFRVPVAEIAARVGTSEAFIQRRLSLANLCDEGREAYFAGKLSHGVAALVARMPVVEHQQAAVKEFTTGRDWDARSGEPWTVSGARRWIQQHFLLRLAAAPFDPADAALVPTVGACATCPKNSGAQPALFAEVTGEDDSCTDASCWKSKVDADWQRKAAEVAKGRDVLSAEQSAKVVQHHGAQGGYVRLDERPHDVGNGRKTWGEILKKAGPAVVLGRDPSGKAVELIAPAEVKRAMKEAGVERKKHSTAGHTEKLVGGIPEYKFRQAVNDRVEERVTAAAIAAVKKGPTAAMWRAAAACALDYFSSNGVATAMFPPPEKNPTGRLDRYVEKATAEQCSALVLTLLLAGEENAELLKVDPKAIEKELKAELEAAAKKKADAETAKTTKGKKGAKPSQPTKPAAAAKGKSSKTVVKSPAPKKAPVEALRDIWLPIAGMKALSSDRRAAYNEVDAAVLGYDSASSNLAVAWEPAGLYCHAKVPYEAYLVLWDMAVVDGLNPSKSAPTEPPPTVPPPAAPPPSKASKKSAAASPERGVNAAQPHTNDLRASTGSPGTACLVILHCDGIRLVQRPKKIDDAAWRIQVGQSLVGSNMVLVARLYSQRGECVWDSRDSEFNGKPVRRFHGVAANDRITLDGVEVDVLHVDEGQFAWRTTEADPKQRDEGVVEWGEVEHVEGTTWRARKVADEQPAPQAEKLGDHVLGALGRVKVIFEADIGWVARGAHGGPYADVVGRVLEALGGGYVGKLRVHVFPTDPSAALAELLRTGVVPAPAGGAS